jgi:hypothetical protein
MEFESLKYWISAANDLLSDEAKAAKEARKRAERDAERERR